MPTLPRRIFGFFAIFIGCAVASPCFAGQTTGVISKITTYSAEAKAVLQIAGTVTGKPACNTGSSFAISLASDTGKAIFAAASEASTRRSTLAITGTNTCSTRAGSEDVGSVDFVPAAELLPTDSIVICSNGSGGTLGKPGDCSCNTGKYIIPKQVTPTSCVVKTSTGLTCTANAFDGRTGACCLCAP